MFNKKIILFAISIAIVSLIIGGFYVLHEKKREHYIDIQKKRIEMYFAENVSSYHKIEITKTEKNPLGSYLIKGYINDDKKLYFTTTINDSSNYQFDNQISTSEKLSNMFKSQSKPNKFPSQIIKEKNLNENDYKADPPFIFGF
ncbi:DUF1433 domain-containing protein [Staphylococcus edaphicus]|uniref:DUF1433 domain-containing protein n=1 Tax=Staphylococcus edaphicus TaxID=1955013 RepID=A0A2C6WJQ3_9STAP|nr:DUF1433 domain-containing protein [Staphylococcus edaphicus]PHK49330.1 hypothetical protein BTJ66_09185 [Staphylococcus edaphicus]UQW80966.1 DUF1433 domain-containing protein [Staphylococcus edaphicus]